MTTDTTANGSDPADTVWLWQRQPDSVELEKVLVPADAVPPALLPLLQRRYTPGDRVWFDHDWPDADHHGTIVQDQGLHVAIDGDTPGRGYTIHKAHVRPTTQAPPENPPTGGGLAVSPHHEPVLRTEGHTIIACWNFPDPGADGWLPQARLRVKFHQRHGFTATLYGVDERIQRGLRQERHRPGDPVVVHHHPTARPSHKAARETLHSALAAVRAAADRGHTVVLAPFCDTTTG